MLYSVSVFEGEKKLYTLETTEYLTAITHFKGAIWNNPKVTHTMVEYEGKTHTLTREELTKKRG